MKKFVIFCLAIFLMGIMTSLQNGKSKIQLELWGGFTTLDPGHLNSRPVAYRQGQDFWGDLYYDYMTDNGYIQSYSANIEGKFKTIKYGFPLGIRVKYKISRRLSLSLGFKYLSQSATSNYASEFTSQETDGFEGIFYTEFAPLKVSAKGYIPLLGIHYTKPFKDNLTLEFFAAAGPLFGKCRFDIDYFSQEKFNNTVSSQSDWLVMEKGSGIGYAVDSGIRLNIDLKNNLGIFLEAGYALQKVNKLSGAGWENSDGNLTTWEGDWGIKERYLDRPWGVLDTPVASNYWGPEDVHLWIRGFVLDLTGFQARIGIFIRL